MKSILLYNGEVEILFDADGSETGKRHSYYRKSGDTLDPITANVTKVTDSISVGDKSGALIGWACKEMGIYLEEKWPRVDDFGSTVPPLRAALPETEFQALIKSAKGAHRKKKAAAATIGSIAHDWIDAHVKATMTFASSPEFPLDPQARSAAEAHLKWEEAHRVHYQLSESKVYSVKHNYVGTLDRVAIVDGVRTILDTKTSNNFRSEYAIQLAAYEMAYLEENPGDAIDQRLIVRLGKETADFEVISIPVERRGADFKAFLGALDVFRWGEATK